jgi:hypothetical protein
MPLRYTLLCRDCPAQGQTRTRKGAAGMAAGHLIVNPNHRMILERVTRAGIVIYQYDRRTRSFVRCQTREGGRTC